MEAESFRLRTTVSREMSEPERRSARPVARPQRLEYPGHAAPAPRERAPRAAAAGDGPPRRRRRLTNGDAAPVAAPRIMSPVMCATLAVRATNMSRHVLVNESAASPFWAARVGSPVYQKAAAARLSNAFSNPGTEKNILVHNVMVDTVAALGCALRDALPKAKPPGKKKGAFELRFVHIG